MTSFSRDLALVEQIRKQVYQNLNTDLAGDHLRSGKEFTVNLRV